VVNITGSYLIYPSGLWSLPAAQLEKPEHFTWVIMITNGGMAKIRKNPKFALENPDFMVRKFSVGYAGASNDHEFSYRQTLECSIHFENAQKADEPMGPEEPRPRRGWKGELSAEMPGGWRALSEANVPVRRAYHHLRLRS
jgi:hypothetical protein